MAKKLLIVDDEEDVRTYLNSLLTNNGYHTLIAVDGEDGFHKVNEFYPDIIILDIIMPNQSGVGFYRKLKKAASLSTPDSPLFFFKEKILEEIRNHLPALPCSM